MSEENNSEEESFSLSFGLKVPVILIAFFITFYRDVSLLANEVAGSELLSYIMAVPILFLFLLYRKRSSIKKALSKEFDTERTVVHKVIGLLLCLIAFFLAWYGTGTFTPLRHHIVAMPIFIAGSVLLLFNGRVLRSLALSIGFLFFLVPLPQVQVNQLAAQLSSWGVKGASSILTFFGHQTNYVTQEGVYKMIIPNASGGPLSLKVGLACSGIYSIMGFAVFAVFVAMISAEDFWKRLVFLAVGFPVIYGLNVLRIVVTGLIGSLYGEGAAMQIFHTFGGFVLMFLGVLLLMGVFEFVFKIPIFSRVLGPEDGGGGAPGGGGSEEGWESLDIKEVGGIFVLLLFSVVSIFAYAPVFVISEGPDELTQGPQGKYPEAKEVFPHLGGYKMEYNYRSEQFESRAGQMASLVYSYVPENAPGGRIWVALEIDSSRYDLHNWEVCASVSGWPIHDKGDVQLLGSPSITARSLYIKRTDFGGDNQSVLYWISRVPFGAEDTGMKYVKVSLVSWTDNPDEARQRLKSIGRKISIYWAPKTGRKAAEGLRTAALPMIFILSAGLVILLMYLSYDRYRRIEGPGETL